VAGRRKIYRLLPTFNCRCERMSRDGRSLSIHYEVRTIRPDLNILHDGGHRPKVGTPKTQTNFPELKRTGPSQVSETRDGDSGEGYAG